MKRKTFPYSLFAAASLLAAGSASATDYTSYTNNTNLTLASGDTLTVSSGNVDISYGGSGTGIGTRTLDASLADSVTFNIGSLRIGTRSDPTNTSTSNLNGTLNLGADNTITASTIVSIAGGGHVDGGSLTTAASSATIINTPTMDIGTLMRASGSLTTGSGSTFTLQGLSGGRTALTVGEERNASSTINWSGGGTMNLSGGQATLKLSSLVVGRSLFASGEVGQGTGTLTMSSNAANQLDISGTGSVVQVGVSAGNQTSGTLTIGNLGSNSTITSTDNGTAILVGNRTGSGDAVTGSLNLNGGTVTITTTGAAIAGGSNATSNLNLDGGVTLKAGASSTNWIQNLDTAVINSGGATIHTNGNNIGFSQVFTGTGGLTKAGDGTLTINTTQQYTGATNVTGGTLVVDGNISTSSLTTIGNGVSAATLQGIGTTGALTISANAFHNPGNSAGIMNTGNYTMTGTLTTEINGLTPGSLHDQVNVAGTVSLSGNLVATFGGGTYANGNLIFILLNDGTGDSITGTFSGLAQGATVTSYGGFDWQISYTGNHTGVPGTSTFTGGNDVVLMAVTAIPEPAAAILGSLGMLVLLRRRRE
jgi:autotransporter-associated beta strand protein